MPNNVETMANDVVFVPSIRSTDALPLIPRKFEVPLTTEARQQLMERMKLLNRNTPEGALALNLINALAASATQRPSFAADFTEIRSRICSATVPEDLDGVLTRHTWKHTLEILQKEQKRQADPLGLFPPLEPSATGSRERNFSTIGIERIEEIVGMAVATFIQNPNRLYITASSIIGLAKYLDDKTMKERVGTVENVMSALKLAGQTVAPFKAEFIQAIEKTINNNQRYEDF